jgi:hypothetical protein
VKSTCDGTFSADVKFLNCGEENDFLAGITKKDDLK